LDKEDKPYPFYQ